MKKQFLKKGAAVAALLLVMAVAGCQLDTEDVKDIIDTITVKDKNELPASIRIVIGRGYDLTGRYAYSPDIKASVLDLDKLIAEKQVMKDPNLRSANFETISGDSLETYQTELSRNISASAEGQFGFGSFSAEVGFAFGEAKASNISTSFATSSSKITKDAYYVENRRDPESLLPYLSEAFKNDLADKDGRALINKYGTHVLLGGVLGARLDYHMSATRKAGKTSGNIGIHAKASAEVKIAGKGGGVSTSYDEDKTFGETYDTGSVETRTQVYGGAPEWGQNVHDSQDYQKWLESIEGNEVWSDYYPASAVLLYSFIEDETKKEEVRVALESYFVEKGYKPTGAQPMSDVVRESYTLDVSHGA
ncbi:MAG: hypothetical protein LBH57_09125, partial [Treponema sp.]|nr:hypothetical protein [Treponema sp.]